MAGSYKHCVTSKGKLRAPMKMREMLDTGGDYYEALEEMYGMIWCLADQLAGERGTSVADEVEDARQRYEDGLAVSPGVQDG